MTDLKKESSSLKYWLINGMVFFLALAALVLAIVAWKVINHTHAEATQLNQTLIQIQATVTENQKNIAQLMTQTSNPSAQQAIVEAAQLIQQAHIYLMIDGNVALAIQLLNLATQRLQPIATTAAIQLKSAMDQDIAALSAVPQVNIASIIMQLNQLSESVHQLSISPQPATRISTMTRTIPTDHWWSKLKKLFIVRHLDTQKAPLMNPQQFLFLQENVRLKLFQAEWAVLHRQPTIYQESLIMAAQWLSEYVQNQPAADSIVKKIQSLEAINIKPSLPTLTSLSVLTSLPPLKTPEKVLPS